MLGIISTIIMALLATAPNRPLHKDTERREEMAGCFIEAGGMYDVDPVLLVVWSFGESSLRTDAKGALGEVGLFQVHGAHRKACKKNGLDLSVPQQQIVCGAMLIDMDRRYCGTLEKGLLRYASGSCRGTPRAKRIVKRRLRQWRELKGEINVRNRSNTRIP